MVIPGVFFTGEKSNVAVPSYYYARPADKYQPGVRKELVDPSNYPTRYSKRVRGMEALEGEDGAEHEEAAEGELPMEEPVQEEKPKYKVIFKKVYQKRASSKGLKSPWLTKKRKYKKVFYYVDEFGNQFPADDMNKSTNPGDEDTSQEKVEDNEKEEGEGKEESKDDNDTEEKEEKKEQESEATNTGDDTILYEETKDEEKEKPEEKLTNGVSNSDDDEEEEEEQHVTRTRASSFRETPNTSRGRLVSPRTTRSAGNSPGRAGVTSPNRQGTSPARHQSPRSQNTSQQSPKSTSG